jgi:hypothetical protein
MLTSTIADDRARMVGSGTLESTAADFVSRPPPDLGLAKAAPRKDDSTADPAGVTSPVVVVMPEDVG